MTVIEAIRSRRSTKTFAAIPVTREQVETLLELAVLAPNHRMSAPWRFLVLGPEARRSYGQVLGGRKAKKVEDPEAAQVIVAKTTAEAVAAPLMLGVIQKLSDNPEILEEDYAATWMAIQNILLGAVELGLGTHLRTGAVFSDPAVRAAWDVVEGERVVAVILLGVPEGEGASKPRIPAADRTSWLD
jgi:nitroreductase